MSGPGPSKALARLLRRNRWVARIDVPCVHAQPLQPVTEMFSPQYLPFTPLNVPCAFGSGAP